MVILDDLSPHSPGGYKLAVYQAVPTDGNVESLA